MVNVKPIRTEADYDEAVAEIEKLWDAPQGSAKGEKLEVLIALVADYEARNFTIEKPTPIEAIKARLDQLGMTRKDLERILGGRSRVTEILKHKRGLSLAMIRRLSEELMIPADLLIAPTVKAAKPKSQSTGVVSFDQGENVFVSEGGLKVDRASKRDVRTGFVEVVEGRGRRGLGPNSPKAASAKEKSRRA